MNLINMIDSKQDTYHREPIYNIWDHDQYFSNVKTVLKNEFSLSSLRSYEQLARAFLASTDYYQVKLGIHILRLCIWHDHDLAREWVTHVAPQFLEHPHARVRQSNLWNVRAAIWQDAKLAKQGLLYAQRGLEDSDSAIRRMSIWIHGDCVINDPELFHSALHSVNNFIRREPKESNYLLLLERFCKPLQTFFASENAFERTVSEIARDNYSMLGLKARCTLALGERVKVSADEMETARQRVFAKTNGSSILALLEEGKLGIALETLVRQFRDQLSFEEKIKTLWLIRDILWLGKNQFHQLPYLLSEDLKVC